LFNFREKGVSDWKSKIKKPPVDSRPMTDVLISI